jgi:ABC-type multidrug transport system ATPase subunit
MTDILRTIDLSKRFRNTVVLDHLNMFVPEHSVYGWLARMERAKLQPSRF